MSEGSIEEKERRRRGKSLKRFDLYYTLLRADMFGADRACGTAELAMGKWGRGKVNLIY